MTRAKAAAYQEEAIRWLSSFSPAFDINDPGTWTKQNLPVQQATNLFRGYAVEHERFTWEARMEPGVVKTFEELWGTEELLVSFDALNITLPNQKDKPTLGAWQHVDQSPWRRGLHCVQGIINLSESGPDDGGLLVYPGSHKLVETFFDQEVDKKSWISRDYYQFSEEQLKWFVERGVKPLKVCASPGDLILWDSRTIHQGTEPLAISNVVRTVIYVAYTPAKMANPEALTKKANIFKAWKGTTHWPHDNIVTSQRPVLEDGTPDPRDRDQPLHKPVLSKQLLRYAGVEPY
jgi:hypothetical protein